MAGSAFLVAKELSDRSNRDNFISWEWLDGENVSYFYKFKYMINYYILQWPVQFSQENMHWWASKHACGC